jgi:hypothetical protein
MILCTGHTLLSNWQGVADNDCEKPHWSMYDQSGSLDGKRVGHFQKCKDKKNKTIPSGAAVCAACMCEYPTSVEGQPLMRTAESKFSHANRGHQCHHPKGDKGMSKDNPHSDKCFKGSALCDATSKRGSVLSGVVFEVVLSGPDAGKTTDFMFNASTLKSSVQTVASLNKHLQSTFARHITIRPDGHVGASRFSFMSAALSHIALRACSLHNRHTRIRTVAPTTRAGERQLSSSAPNAARECCGNGYDGPHNASLC